MTRVPPSERIRKEIEELLSKGLHEYEGDLTGTLVRLGAQQFLQELLEQELTQFLGRGHYERRAHGEELKGYRNGYEPGRVRTAEGEIPVYIPQVRNTRERFESALLGFLSQHTDVLERLVVEMYARGLSTRDIEDAFSDATGKCLMTRTGVSKVTEVLHGEYEAFSKRELGSFEIVYLFLDAIYEPLRRAGMREGILCAWGVTADGMKVLLHMTLGSKESHNAWLQMLRDMVSRGLRTPLTVTSDGAPGLIRAVEEVFPLSLRVRCWAHKMRNVLDKVPDDSRAEVKAFLEAVRDAPTEEAGQEAAGDVLDRFGERFPAAMRSFSDDLEASLAHLMVPVRHRKCVRTTNLIERSFVEERRRTKTLPYFMTEKSCLKLVFSTVWRASFRWQLIRMSELEQKQLSLLAKRLGIDPGPGGGHQAEPRERVHSVA